MKVYKNNITNTKVELLSENYLVETWDPETKKPVFNNNFVLYRPIVANPDNRYYLMNKNDFFKIYLESDWDCDEWQGRSEENMKAVYAESSIAIIGLIAIALAMVIF